MDKKPIPSSESIEFGPPKRMMPPVCTATGGLMPGIDPKNVARSALELEDLEYIERLKNGFR